MNFIRDIWKWRLINVSNCLKRREEEKTEELPGRHGQSAAELAQQAALAAAGKVGFGSQILWDLIIF